MKIGFLRLDDSNLYEHRSGTVLEPLGLEYVMGNIVKNEMRLWDLNAFEEFRDYESCDIICITVPTPLYNQAKRIIKQIHETCKAKVVVGGTHPSIAPRECIVDLGAHVAVVGEGETVFDWNTPHPYDFLKGDSPCILRPEANADIDSIKFPYRHRLGNYKINFGKLGVLPVASMITSRSCPYQCVFCSSKRIFGNKLRMRSVPNITAEITDLVSQGVESIIFLDDTFTFDRKRVIHLCADMIERKFDLNWWVDTRVDKVDAALLDIMRNAGCSMIVYGIESGNQGVLNRIRKGIRLEDAERAIRETKAAGIQCKANFMLGHHAETRAEMQDTIDLAYLLNADVTSFYQVIPLPGTELEQYHHVTDTAEYDRLKWYGSDIPTICEPSIGPAELKKIQQYAYERTARPAG